MTEAVEKYNVDTERKFLSLFVGAKPPDCALEVEKPPANGKQLWRSGRWTEPVANAQAHGKLLRSHTYNRDHPLFATLALRSR